MPIPVKTLLAHVDAMRRLAGAVVQDPDRADDVTQTAILTAIRRPPSSQRNIRGWLFGVVRNAARDERKRERRQVARDQGAARPDRAPDAASMASQIDAQKRLLGAVLKLPEPYRDVVWLRYFEGLAPRKVAERLSIPVETVRTRHRRALQRLRTALDDQHEGERGRWMAALLPIAGVGAPKAPWIGGALMASKVKSISLAALVLLALVAGWFLIDATFTTEPRQKEAAQRNVDAAAPQLKGASDAGSVAEEPVDTVLPDDAIRVHGFTHDEEGKPLAGCEILVGPLNVVDVERLGKATRSDANGSFVFAWPENIQGGVRVVARAGGRAYDGVRLLSPPTRAIDFRLPRERLYVLVARDGETDRRLANATATAKMIVGAVTIDVHARADARGRIEIPGPTGQDPNWFPIQIAAPGYQPIKQTRASLGAGATAQRPRDVYLFESQGFRVQVTDVSGRIVEGVTVEAWSGGASFVEPDPRADGLAVSASDFPDTSRVIGSAVSDEHGFVSFPPLASDNWWHVRARHGATIGYAFARFHKADKRHRTVVLRPAGDVVVEVVDASGEPVRDAWVKAWPGIWTKALQGGGFGMPPTSLQRAAMGLTDDAGVVTLADVQRSADISKQHVSAQRMGLGVASEPLPALPADGPARVRIVLEPKRPVIPIVVVDTSDEPLADALVSYQNMFPGVVTDKAGRAALQSHYTPPGKKGMDIIAAKRGYARAREAVPEAGQTLTLVLHPERVLHGRVVDANGEGVSGTIDFYRGEVADLPEAEREKRARMFQQYSLGRSHSDSNGYFRHGGLPPGPWYVHAWRGDEHARVSIHSAEEPCTLHLSPSKKPVPPTGHLRGEVRTLDGSVLTKYRVSLRAEKRSHQPVLQGRRFLFEDVPAGPYTLRAYSADATQRVEMPVDVIAGKEEVVQVTLGDSFPLRARVLAPNGDPVRDVAVRTYRKDTGRIDAYGRTDEDGWIQIEHRLAGSYRVELHSPLKGSVFALKDTYVRIGPDAPPAPTLRALAAARIVLDLDDERFQEAAKALQNPYQGKGWVSLGTLLYLTDAAGRTQRDFGLWHGRRSAPWALLPGRYHLKIETREHGTFETNFVVDKSATDVVVQVRLRD